MRPQHAEVKGHGIVVRIFDREPVPDVATILRQRQPLDQMPARTHATDGMTQRRALATPRAVEEAVRHRRMLQMRSRSTGWMPYGWAGRRGMQA